MIYKSTLLTKTQADGAVSVSLGAFDKAHRHQIQVETSATPAAGTLTVAVKTPGASTYTTLSPTISLVSPTIYTITGYVSDIQFTPASFDGDKTYSVTIISGAYTP